MISRKDSYRTCGLGLNSEPVQNQFEPVQPSFSQSSQTMHTLQQLSVKVTQYIHISDTIHTHQQLSHSSPPSKTVDWAEVLFSLDISVAWEKELEDSVQLCPVQLRGESKLTLAQLLPESPEWMV